MKTSTRFFAVLLAALMVCVAFGGCGKSKNKDKDGTGSVDSAVSETGGESEGAAGTGSETNGNGAGTGSANGTAGKTSSAAPAKGTTEIVWWCTYDTRKDVALQQIVKNYNASQKQYRVKCLQMGSAGALVTKMMTLTKKNYPSLFNGTPYTLSTVADGTFAAPIQDFLDKDTDKWTNDMFETVKQSYRDRNGRLIGIPIGVSVTGWSVNLDMLGKTKKPDGSFYSLSDCTSYESIAEIAIAAKDQKTTPKYGISFNRGTNIHDMLRVQGVDIVNNENGWKTTPTKSLLDSGAPHDALKKFATITAELYQKGVAYPQSGGSGGWTFAPDFNRGNILFWANTNSYIADVNDNVGKPAFKTAWIATTGVDNGAKYRGQCLSEGTGVFIANTGDKTEMQGAYEFLKYTAKTEAQEIWCTTTSYVPYTNKAAASSKITTWQKSNFPEADAVINTLKSSTNKLKGTYGEVNATIEDALLDITTALSADPNKNIESLIKTAHQAINNAAASQALGK